MDISNKAFTPSTCQSLRKHYHKAVISIVIDTV
jgi:hypothetical protein